MRYTPLHTILIVLHLLECGVRAQEAPVKSTYDYIVVGGGTSGLTVADRLTANGNGKLSPQ